MKVYVNLYFKDSSGKLNKHTISYINPDASDAQLRAFADAMKNLTDNSLENVMKVVDTYLSSSDIPDITWQDIEDILNERYQQVEVDEGITQLDIDKILDGTYELVEVLESITQADIDEILADWS